MSSFYSVPGQAATVQVGTVTTVAPENAATVTNSGTPTAAVLNFNIPRGITGNVAAAGDGTAALPSITFANDVNTGIYRPGPDQLALSTNGTGRLRVTSGGQVLLEASNSFIGVNTEDGSDTSTLLVGGGGAGSNSRGAYVWMKGNENTDAGALVLSAGNVGTAPITAFTGGSERLRITSAGLVGIGTSSPPSQLTVSKTAAGAEGATLAIQNTGSGANTSVALHLVPNPGGGNDVARAASIKSRQTLIGNFADLGFFTANSDTPQERLTIGANGRVGIGTTSPSALLHSVVASAGVAFRGSNNNTGIDLYANDATGEARLTASRLGGSGGKFLSFYTDTGSGEFERCRLDSSGRLLVGTSSDSGGALFQVNGDRVRIATAKTPASASATGTAGEVCWDTNYIYVCTATNTWKRAALSTW